MGEPDRDAEILGCSKAAGELRRLVGVFGPTDLAVLLQGESGVGKEVVATAIHLRSRRRGPLVPVNVSAIPAELLEAELFGSVKGAFTGAANSRMGLARAADGGTLFLDEVGDLAPGVQSKLLRFLSSMEVRAVGSTRFERVDVRVVSATNRTLEDGIEAGWFRPDLYFRLAATTIRVPPLRDRREDIRIFTRHFDRRVTRRLGLESCRWTTEAWSALEAHRWPGNVRELRHAVEVAVISAAGGTVTPELLPIAETDLSAPVGWGEAVHQFRRSLLRTALRRNRGNRSATARELGISRQTLHYHMRNLGI